MLICANVSFTNLAKKQVCGLLGPWGWDLKKDSLWYCVHLLLWGMLTLSSGVSSTCWEAGSYPTCQPVSTCLLYSTGTKACVRPMQYTEAVTSIPCQSCSVFYWHSRTVVPPHLVCMDPSSPCVDPSSNRVGRGFPHELPFLFPRPRGDDVEQCENPASIIESMTEGSINNGPVVYVQKDSCWYPCIKVILAQAIPFVLVFPCSKRIIQLAAVGRKR